MIRASTYRLHPCTPARARKLHQLSGACRYVWNHFLANNRRRYKAWADTQRFCEDMLLGLVYERPEKPSVTFFSLGKAFTKLRAETDWLQDVSFTVVRYTLKRQADAWKRAFEHGGFPKFKSKRGNNGFTIPGNVRIKIGAVTGVRRLYVPKIGWCILSRSGGCPYDGAEAKQAVVKRVNGKWYCTVFYAVQEMATADNGLSVGIDRNVGQIALSTGWIIPLPDVSRLEARKRRYQRIMARRVEGSRRRRIARHRCAKASRKLVMVRKDWSHQTSRMITDAFGTVVMEDLNTQGMIRSAKGTADAPGTNVAAKAGLNRQILASAWSALRSNLEYKAVHFMGVDPKYTSQTCHACGVIAKRGRKSQSRFECPHCGYVGNADVNAALNILARGVGASGRGGSGIVRPVKRQRDMPVGGLAAVNLST
ncbi:MAG: transposase [Gammaproteobacteria bacterium]|nr:transposase [Gammaproteobacteria bacterium]